jgi:hypothetical protein
VEKRADDPFLTRINATDKKWAVLVDPEGEPQLVLNVDDFTRACLYGKDRLNPYDFCHRPIIVRDTQTTLGDVIRKLKSATHNSGEVMENDVVLIWTDAPRIITGSDILGRLLTGIGDSRYL